MVNIIKTANNGDWEILLKSSYSEQFAYRRKKLAKNSIEILEVLFIIAANFSMSCERYRRLDQFRLPVFLLKKSEFYEKLC